MFRVKQDAWLSHRCTWNRVFQPKNVSREPFGGALRWSYSCLVPSTRGFGGRETSPTLGRTLAGHKIGLRGAFGRALVESGRSNAVEQAGQGQWRVAMDETNGNEQRRDPVAAQRGPARSSRSAIRNRATSRWHPDSRSGATGDRWGETATWFARALAQGRRADGEPFLGRRCHQAQPRGVAGAGRRRWRVDGSPAPGRGAASQHTPAEFSPWSFHDGRTGRCSQVRAAPSLRTGESSRFATGQVPARTLRVATRSRSRSYRCPSLTICGNSGTSCSRAGPNTTTGSPGVWGWTRRSWRKP